MRGLARCRAGNSEKVRSVGPGWFALVMATGIVSTAANRQGFPRISLGLLAVAAVSYGVLVVLSLLRLWRWPGDVRADLVTAPRAFGFFAIVAGSAVLGERLFEQHAETVALALLAVAVVGWLVLGYAVPAAVVLARDKPAFAAAVDGSWLLWVVATQSVSTAAALTARRTLPELATVTAVTTWCGRRGAVPRAPDPAAAAAARRPGRAAADDHPVLDRHGRDRDHRPRGEPHPPARSHSSPRRPGGLARRRALAAAVGLRYLDGPASA